ncbi:hypothetical protein [Denitrobaculum tricleocarpae]|uniref:Uncharacterized protein n=1 Tax=Denitrobaculum tricleocarpae TaxID=2591009 RepID=A0A545TPX5_9PROT|nr:hypothetical protein [Denitrobaculum tricleocarpae]TQV79275.1 hypothetical protein FKG95_16620 [Denitrobaculum tricleocarpae]
MNYLLVILASFIAVELFLRLPVIDQVHQLFGTTHKAGHVITARAVSDHWKERVMLRYAREIMLSSVKLVLFLTGVLMLAVLPAFLVQLFIDPSLSIEALFSSWTAVGVSLVAATLYYIARARFAR